MGWLRLVGSLQIVGLFCKRALSKRLYSAKKTHNFKEPTNRSHPILNARCCLAVGQTFSKTLLNAAEHRTNVILNVQYSMTTDHLYALLNVQYAMTIEQLYATHCSIFFDYRAPISC